MKSIYTIALAGLLAGCSLNQTIPKTRISGTIGGKPFSLESPKDSDLIGLEVCADTNGMIRVKIERLTVNMNPTNISNAGNAQAQIVTATADAINRAIQNGAAIAGAVAGAAIKAP